MENYCYGIAKKALEFEFTAWLEHLEEEERDRIVPPNNVITIPKADQVCTLYLIG